MVFCFLYGGPQFGKLARTPVELDGLLEAADDRRGLHEHGAVAVDELGIGLAHPAAVGVDVLLLPLGQGPDVHLPEVAVDEELGVETLVAVVVGGEGLVVPGEGVFQHGPGRPGCGEPALGRAGGQDLPGRALDLLPGGRGLVAEASFPEGVLVVIEDRARGVEGHGVELAVLRVVAGHGPDEVVPVDGDLLLLHQLPGRHDGPRQEHGLGPHLEDLDDVRGVLLPVGGDGRGQDFRIGPLVEGLDLVLPLALVELLHQLVHRLAELATHGVPEVDLRPGLGLRQSSQESDGGNGDQASGAFHEARHGVLLSSALAIGTDGKSSVTTTAGTIAQTHRADVTPADGAATL